MAIKFIVSELAKAKGLNGYAITKKLGSRHPYTGYRLLKVDEQDSISKDTIEAICEAFDCEPKDFIIRVADSAQPPAKTTPPAKKSSRKNKS